MKFSEIILDADMCIKLGGFESINVLEIIIPQLTNKAYIHKYVYEDEILTPKSARMQIQNLVKSGIIKIVHEEELNSLEKNIFYATTQILQSVMIGVKKEGKNWGEVLSLAMAKTKEIPIFMSDERDLQELIDFHLNTGNDSNIKVFRLKNLIEWIKTTPECNLKRSFTKAVWATANAKNKSDVQKRKKIFDEELWTLDVNA